MEQEILCSMKQNVPGISYRTTHKMFFFNRHDTHKSKEQIFTSLIATEIKNESGDDEMAGQLVPDVIFKFDITLDTESAVGH